MEKGAGQIVILTSASGEKPLYDFLGYSSMRAAANTAIQCAAMTAAPKGVCINAFGTNLAGWSIRHVSAYLSRRNIGLFFALMVKVSDRIPRTADGSINGYAWLEQLPGKNQGNRENPIRLAVEYLSSRGTNPPSQWHRQYDSGVSVPLPKFASHQEGRGAVGSRRDDAA